MRFHRADNLLFCSDNERDLDYVRAVSELVLARYNGETYHWRPARSDELWRIFTGGRASVVGVRHAGRVACVKLFYDDRWRTRIRTRLGLSKARRAYRNGLRLRTAGVLCPQMIGYAERRPTGPALLVTELITGAARIDHWLAQRGIGRDMAEALARSLRAMHDKGVCHLDLSPRNILVRQRDGGFEFLMVDYEDARFASEIGRRQRIDNLHHLHERMAQCASLRDRLRFLRFYAGREYRAYRQALRQRMLRSPRNH